MTVCLADTTLGQDHPPVSGGDHNFEITHQKRKRYYTLHIPPHYDGIKPMPLVIVLHGGAGNRKNVMRMTGMSKKADKEGFFVLYPAGTGFFKHRVLTWNAANCCGYAKRNNVDDVAFIRTLLDTLQAQYKIDSKRIYATGISNGGMLAYRLACRMGDRIAAIAPVAAAFNEVACQPAEPVSVIIFHGKLDEHVLYDGGLSSKSRTGRFDQSMVQTMSFWIHHNNSKALSTYQHHRFIVKEVYSEGTNGTAVVLYTITNGGHAWPGGRKGFIFSDEPSREISATDVIWEFFKNHPKP